MKFKIFNYKEVNSTNDVAIDLIKKKKCEKGVVFALEQTKGRGRYGRKWISEKGNLFTSIFFNLKKNFPNIEEFTLINAILNIDVLRSYCKGLKIEFKKPNDIFLNRKKICGILQETIIKDKKKYLIIGIGINVVSNPLLKKYKSTNLFFETKKKNDPKKIVIKICNKYSIFFQNLSRYNFKNFKSKSKNLLMRV